MLEFLLSKIDVPYRYTTVASFLACLAIQEALSPWLSRRMTSSYAQLSSVQQVEWDNRIMSIAHALTASFLSLLAFFVDEGLTPDAVRRLLMMTGSKKTSQAYKVNGILFVLTFFVFRIAVIPWFWHNWLFRLTVNPDYYLPENAVPLNTSISEGIIMNVLNSYWFVRLCIVTWRHLSLSKEHDE
uniref:Uncharacterized protein n=1 Tax=Branchiostoma floridae TaxID=7739 RepID=C3XXS3_BRAFL|eukprot:XP_002611523.1 hypothetical protein BRAFLDRAFT_63840 [Branchiostoma floridae]